MGRIPSRGADQFMLRFPDGMRDRVKKLAEQNGRSMNSQIIYMLEYAFDDMDTAAHIHPNADKAEATREFLRDEIRKARAILTHVLADYEDPESDISKYLAEKTKETP